MKENSMLTMMPKGNCEAIASERKERFPLGATGNNRKTFVKL